MQPSCDDIELLISKYVDGEATPDERALVEDHVAACDSCAYTLTSFMEMAAIFSEAPVRVPAPHLQSNVFANVKRLQESERHREEVRASGSHSRPSGSPPLPQYSPQVPPRRTSVSSRLWSLGSPFAVMGTAVAALLVIMTVAAPRVPITNPVPRDVAGIASPVLPGDLPTKSYQSVQNAGIPSPVVTRLAYTPTSSEGATVRSTATFVRGNLMELAEPTAVLEGGDVARLSNWHLVRDPAYGYSISYPPNWWTHVTGSTRYFFPWGEGGTRYAPYWIELRVMDNPNGYNAETANAAMFGGACQIEAGSSGGGQCLRRSTEDEAGVYDELYAFDADHIYLLRARVPWQSGLGSFNTRWEKSQAIFARMSGSMSLAVAGGRNASGFAPILFLNGTDLWTANPSGSGARPLTRGYVVRQFALSSDLRRVAIAATNDFSKALVEAKYLYILDSQSDGPVTPSLLGSDLSVIYDIAWYGDRDLLAIGKQSDRGKLGLYRISVGQSATGSTESMVATTLLLADLPAEMRSARGLAVAPDRQLITFLAPLGEQQGTDIYSLRPDGTDLRKVISHADALPPTLDGENAIIRENQAVKSYTWLDGRLENGSYYVDLLFTCGTNESPTLYRGGYLYSAAGAARGTMLNPSMLAVDDAQKVQIVHIAYSSQGKVALSGFYSLRDDRAEVLAGLWTADLADGVLVNLQPQPMPAAPNGIADLQWSPNGKFLLYRETMPRRESSMISRYEGDLAFKMMRLDPATGEQTVLYDGTSR